MLNVHFITCSHLICVHKGSVLHTDGDICHILEILSALTDGGLCFCKVEHFCMSSVCCLVCACARA